MSIPINDIVPRIQATAGAGQTVFNYPFPIFANTDLLVYQTPAGQIGNDVNDILTLNTDYTVTGVGAANGGTIVLTVGTAINDIVTIIRDMPEDRMNLYLNGGLFTAVAVNDDFSRDVMMNQQNEMREAILTPHYNNSGQVSLGINTRDQLLPILPANTIWRMNAAGTAIEAVAFAAGGGGTTVVLPTVANHVATFTDAVGTLHDSGFLFPVADGPANSVLGRIGPFQLGFVAGVGTVSVNQALHGLVAGNVVRLNGANYVTAQADSAVNAEVVGIVTVVTDANNFTLQTSDRVTTGLAGLVAGTVYFLSPTVAGALTAVQPVNPGQVIKPLLIADTATSGFFNNQLGLVI